MNYVSNNVRQLVAPLCLMVSLSLFPQTVEAQWGGEFRGQMGLGGDEIANVTYSDGSNSDLKLGTYFSFTAGPTFEAWTSGSHALEFQGMAGWAGWSTGPENTDDRLSLNRFPLEVLAFYGYRMPERDMMLRIGGGAAYHLIGGVGGSGVFETIDMGIENAAGAVAEVGAVFGILSAGVRYTRMNNALDQFVGSLDGSSLGFHLGLTTPRN